MSNKDEPAKLFRTRIKILESDVQDYTKNYCSWINSCEVVVIDQEETFGVHPTMEQINKPKVVGFKEFFDTFDISDLVLEDVHENYLNGNCSSESCQWKSM